MGRQQTISSLEDSPMDIRLPTPPVPTWTLRPSFRMSAKVKLALGVRLSGGRGRDEDFSSPPAQIPTNAAKKAVGRGFTLRVGAAVPQSRGVQGDAGLGGQSDALRCALAVVRRLLAYPPRGQPGRRIGAKSDAASLHLADTLRMQIANPYMVTAGVRDGGIAYGARSGRRFRTPS